MRELDLNLLPGRWVGELIGATMLSLKKRLTWCIELKGDQTLSQWRKVKKNEMASEEAESAPDHPDLWSVKAERTLVIRRAIRPMPEYGMRDWFYEESEYDILELSDSCLTLGNGEFIFVFRRQLPDPWAE